MQRDDDDSAAWADHDDCLRQQEQYVCQARYEFARVAELAAKLGHCPEAAAGVERTLLAVANLEPEPVKDERQAELNLAA